MSDRVKIEIVDTFTQPAVGLCSIAAMANLVSDRSIAWTPGDMLELPTGSKIVFDADIGRYKIVPEESDA